MTFEIIPPNLAAISRGRDHLTTVELATATNHRPQTVRKVYCTTGAYFGIRPIKLGNRLLWPVNEVARLLNGEAV